MNFVVFEVSTGEIKASYVCPNVTFAEAQCRAGQAAIQVEKTVRDTTHWVNPQTNQANLRDTTPCVVSKTEVPADGATRTTLSRLRPGTQITITGPEQHTLTVDDGSLELTFTAAGRYTIRAEAPFPAMPIEVVIDAT